MAGVLEETTSSDIDRTHVEQRVRDWLDRINSLYAQIEGWLPAGWTAARRGAARMREELMAKFELPAEEMPVLELSYRGKPSARLEPRGLWIIGANGRLDLFRGDNHYIIVDAAENFGTPEWHIAPLSDRRNLQRLTAQTLASAL
jgi:hypothetical protein